MRDIQIAYFAEQTYNSMCGEQDLQNPVDPAPPIECPKSVHEMIVYWDATLRRMEANSENQEARHALEQASNILIAKPRVSHSSEYSRVDC